MKANRLVYAGLILFTSFAWAAQPERQAVLSDIHKTLGFVPSFLKALPEVALPGAWQQMKSLEMAQNTALTPKHKELIGLAVAAQIPCKYCVYAHTELARMNGASPAEIGLALAESGVTRMWSTFLNGSQIDRARFRQDINALTQKLKQPKAQAEPAKAIDVVDAASAYKDIERVMGLVPDFMRRYPANAIAGAWVSMRDIEMNPNGAMPEKYVSLIGLSVASQIPCEYCVEAVSEIGRAQGLSDAELAEAVAMAAHTRNMSTLLNGVQLDEVSFKNDILRLTQPKGRKTAER